MAQYQRIKCVKQPSAFMIQVIAERDRIQNFLFQSQAELN